jgi:hypothetical protein
MAAGIRKCLDLGPLDDGGDQDGNLHNAAIVQRMLETRTRWVRIWIRWPKAQLGPGHFEWGYIGLIDQQIAIAKAHGLGVVLVNWEFPRWANGTANVNPNTYAVADRDQGGGNLKSLEQGVPSGQLGVNGYWGQWINFLINRYRGYSCGIVLEIMNEPNFQWWPQRDANNSIISHLKAAEMMHTAAQINAWYGNPIPLAAPAISDTRRASDRRWTRYSDFIPMMRQALQSYNFRGNSMFMWSHHNYADVETASTAAWALTRNTLAGWWLGWSQTNANGSNPGIWITEGGCRLNEAGGNSTTQANRVWNMYQTMVGAPGAAMFTNYLLHTATSYNTGVLEVYPNATRRPVWQRFHDMAPNA